MAFSPVFLEVTRVTIAEKEKRWAKRKEVLIREQKLKADMAKYKKPLSMSKKMLIYIVVNCTVVQVYAMVAMFVLQDLSALYALITAVVGETIAFFIYEIKAARENTSEHGTTVLAMKRQHELEDREPVQPEPGP